MLQSMHPQLASRTVDKIIGLANMVRAANMHPPFDLSIRALRRWAGLVLGGVGSWAECYEFAILDLMGPETTKAAGRGVLREIAKNAGVDKW